MNDLAKIANDLIMFSMPEFGYFSLPDKFCTGSSIMPQKKNPDVLELVRAKSAIVSSLVYQINLMTGKLMSGYNRDFQLTKKPLIKGFEHTACLPNYIKPRLEQFLYLKNIFKIFNKDFIKN